jgi:hypothetical protein
VTERLDNPKARMHRVICRRAAVPEGWVVVGEHHSPACDGSGANALVVKRPGRREVVIADSPVPEGYRRVRPSECDGADGWLIERVGDVDPE